MLIDYRPDGKIAIDFDGKPITLRIPKIREYEELLKYADELDDELQVFTDVRERIIGKDEENPVTPAEVADFVHARRMIAAKFSQKAVELLGDKTPPEDLEDYPAFLMDFSLPARFQSHWQTAPLGSSNPETLK